MVPLVPNEYRIAATLMLMTEQLIQKQQQQQADHQAAVRKHSKH
jgi:hypothetical protein